ncbi:hypothetical protein ACHAWF_006175 [Thalassiosira exigua]
MSELRGTAMRPPTNKSVLAGEVPPSPISRILSGSVGSIVYVLAFTPLEVVKVRQQAGSSEALPSSPRPVKAFLRGRGAVMMENGLILPKSVFPCLVAPQYRYGVRPAGICSRLFDSASHSIQTQSGGILSMLRSIYRNEGRAGLFAGLRPTLLAAVPNTAIYFTAYDEISHLLRHRFAEHESLAEKQHVLVPLIAGSTARLVSCMATAPLELVRTRQASSVGNSNSILEEFRFITRMHGPLALYGGFGPMIMRDVPFSALYFLGLESFKSALSTTPTLGHWGAHYYQERGVKVPTRVEATQAFISGLSAGAIATILTTPFDVVKTRWQAARGAGGKKGADQGMYCYMKQIIREEGFFAGLWRGNSTRMVKVAP